MSVYAEVFSRDSTFNNIITIHPEAICNNLDEIYKMIDIVKRLMNVRLEFVDVNEKNVSIDDRTKTMIIKNMGLTFHDGSRYLVPQIVGNHYGALVYDDLRDDRSKKVRSAIIGQLLQELESFKSQLEYVGERALVIDDDNIQDMIAVVIQIEDSKLLDLKGTEDFSLYEGNFEFDELELFLQDGIKVVIKDQYFGDPGLLTWERLTDDHKQNVKYSITERLHEIIGA
jgi:hypothetical protein